MKTSAECLRQRLSCSLTDLLRHPKKDRKKMVAYCPICAKPVYFGEKKRSLGRDYHPLCLKCYLCKRQLTPGMHAEYDEKPYCNHCYMKQFGPRVNRRSVPHSSLGAAS
ncbi:cysteine-rich protein 1 [Amia ocellicauda]|uniref:cysteine-rich protein 1 n=1 Tax=Amia ocellicauda TaxID=2972642 RepID=UPI0034641009